MSGPILTAGGNVVVVDGSTRARWTRVGSEWRFGGLWPDDTERHELEARLRTGCGLLVLADRPTSTVQALGTEVGVPEDTIDVPVAALDWLPEPLRSAGLASMRESRSRIDALPVLLRPPVVVGGPLAGTLAEAWRVRVAVATASAVSDVRALSALADHVFGVAGARRPVASVAFLGPPSR